MRGSREVLELGRGLLDLALKVFVWVWVGPGMGKRS